LGGLGLAADDDLERRPDLGVTGGDEAEGYALPERGREAAGGDGPDDRPRLVRYLGALAGRRALQHLQRHAHAGRALGELAHDPRRAREVALLAAVLVDREGEVSLDRRDGLVEVVAVERQAGLQAQAVPRPQADRLDAGV